MGKLNIGLIRNIIMVVIILIILFQVLADTSADIGDAATDVSNASTTGTVLPLVSFFKKKGVILLAMIAGIVITVITAVLPKGK